MSGLRFAMVTTFYPPFNFGGDGIAVQRLARALVRRGHRVTVLHDVDAYRALADGRDPEPCDEPEGLSVVGLESPLGPIAPLLTHQTGRPVVHGRRLRRLLDAGDFDVIHYNNVSLVGGPGVLSVGNGVKIYEAHEHWLVCPTHVLWRHAREPCDERECFRCVLRHRRPPQLWRTTGYLESQLRHVDAFIAKSEFSRQKHREFGFSREMTVVPYFLPEADAPEDPNGESGEPPHSRPYFLFVGRLEQIKGLDDVIPIFRGSGNADLLVAGDGEDGGRLRSMGADHSRVKFLGRVPSVDLARYYRHARALIVPSRCFETFGIVLIEAFRSGTPVIARRIGPFPEIIRQSEGGMLFEDAADLARCVARLESDDDLQSKLATSARRGFSRLWTERAVLPRYLAVVRKAAAGTDHDRILDRLETEQVA